VQDRDVAGADEIEQRGELPAKHAHIHLPLLLPEGAAVTLRSVQPVVEPLRYPPVEEPLRYPEEVLVTFDHDPSAPDPSFDQILEQLMEELGDSSTFRGRVHVPERSSFESVGDRAED